MTTSTSPAAKSPAAPEEPKERTRPAVEPSPPPQTSPAPAADPIVKPRPASSVVEPAVAHSVISLGTVFWVLVIAGSAAGWYYLEHWWPKVATMVGLEQAPPPKAPPRVIPVATATVQQKDMEVYINGLGTVTAFKTVTIRSRVEGELLKVAFTEGQIVQEGELLAEIDRRPFEVQLQQAKGQLARDEATLKSADFTFKRYEELLPMKSIAPQQVDEQRALVQQTTGAIQSDHAMVANAELQLKYCSITAPITGRIGLRLVDQGNIVRANDPNGIAVITQLQPIALVFTIPQDDISRVQQATADGSELTVLAYDRNFKPKLAEGKLVAIDNQVDSTTGTVRLKAVFDNEDGLLFPNQFVNARLLVSTRQDAIVVPSAAVQRGPTSTFVYVVQPDDTVDLRVITPGLTEGAETAIESGLEKGEIVVTDGLDKLQKGTAITTGAKDKDRGKGKSSDVKANPTEKAPAGDPKSATEPKSDAIQKSEAVQKTGTAQKPDTVPKTDSGLNAKNPPGGKESK